VVSSAKVVAQDQGIPGGYRALYLQFCLHCHSQCSQPFVLHYQHLDLVFRQLAILRRDLSLQVLLRPLYPVAGFGFLFQQRQVFLHHLQFIQLTPPLDFLEPCRDRCPGNLLLLVLPLGQQPVLTPMFLGHFLQLLGYGGNFSLQGFDTALLFAEVAGYEHWGRNQVSLELLSAYVEICHFLGLLVLND
jgi:hypothetical protein